MAGHNHYSWCTCPYCIGGGNTGGRARSSSINVCATMRSKSLAYTNLPNFMVELARIRHQPVVNPSTCKYCGQEVYFYANEYGSRVFFDELGPPWPKHCCENLPLPIKTKVLQDYDYSDFFDDEKLLAQDIENKIIENEIKLPLSMELPRLPKPRRNFVDTSKKTTPQKTVYFQLQKRFRSITKDNFSRGSLVVQDVFNNEWVINIFYSKKAFHVITEGVFNGSKRCVRIDRFRKYKDAERFILRFKNTFSTSQFQDVQNHHDYEEVKVLMNQYANMGIYQYRGQDYIAIYQASYNLHKTVKKDI